MEQILTNSTDERNDYLSDYSQKDQKWDQHRSESQSVGELYGLNQDYIKYEERISKCSSILGFADSVNKETGEINWKLRTASFCRVRHCPVCNWRRTLRNTARFLSALPNLTAKYPTHRYLFLTLTVPNCPVNELKSTIQAMNKGWVKLTKRKEFKPIKGFVRSTEVTRAENGFAHPHFHCLLIVQSNYFAKNYIKQARWLELWQQSLGRDDVKIVDVRAVKSDNGQIEKAVLETLKYSIKPSDLIAGDPDWLFAITDQLHKLRFLATGGVLKDLLKEDLSNEEMIVGEDGEASEADKEPSVFFTWRPSQRRYKLFKF